MSDILQIMQEAARAAGEIQKDYFRTELDISTKGFLQNLVSKADLESQDRIKEEITSGMVGLGYTKAEIGFVGEEDLHETGEHTFIVDPLDGTTNFASGLDHFCVSIAYARGDELQAGVIYRPTTDELYFAQAGQGSFKIHGDSTIQLQIESRELIDCLTGVFINVDPVKREYFERITTKLLDYVRAIRILAAFALDMSWFAEGIFGLLIDRRTKLWDMAAGYTIIREAGGWVSDLNGNEIEIDIANPDKWYNVICCHPDIRDEVLGLLAD